MVNFRLNSPQLDLYWLNLSYSPPISFPEVPICTLQTPAGNFTAHWCDNSFYSSSHERHILAGFYL
jgi:hypothetical protein